LVWKAFATVGLVVVGVAAVVYAMGGLGPQQAAATQYLTATASSADVNQEVAATGSIGPSSSTALAFGATDWDADDTASAPTQQTVYDVATVKVAVGDTVKKGDVLATADTSDLRAQLTQAKNSLESAVLSLRSAEKAVTDATTTDTRRQAKINELQSINGRDAAQATVDDLETKIAAATLRSDIGGVVSTVSVVAGRQTPNGAAIVIESSTFSITTDVVEDDVANIKSGQTAAITISAIGANLTGTVTEISRTANAATNSGVVSFPVTVTIDSVPATARSGMTADVTITIASAKNVLAVPASALRGRAGAYTVLVMNGTAAPSAVSVDVGLVTDSLAEIKSGLNPGEVVVTGTASALAGSTNTGGFGGGLGVGGFRNGGGNGPQVRVGQ
jgi:RND family efflux transporter MFP subunit